MILYFADRTMNIKGQASTALLKGLQIIGDRKVEEVETGVASFECTISFDDSSRLHLEEMTEAGNYLLRSKDGENEFYTIIDTEIDTKRQEIYIYAEDAGLDLLNEIAGEYEADKSYTIDHYVEKWINDSGFEIGINEVPTSTTRKLSWTGETSVTDRLASIATQFGGYEISYSFRVKGMEITRKYVNIHKKRGQENGIQLRLNREIDRIITKKSVANLATAFICTGGNMDSSTTILQTVSNGVSYSVDLETASRTANTVKISATIKAALTSKDAELGDSYGLKASIYVGGSWHSVTIKSTAKDDKRKWSGTTSHSTGFSFTVSGVSAGVVTFSDIKFKVERTDSNSGSVGVLASTACSSFSVPNYISGGENGENINSRPITLEGYTYDDGDFYVEKDGVLRSRKAVQRWSRYVWNKEPNRQDNAKGHIWKTFSYETTSQATLCSQAIAELKKVCDMEINFDVEFKRLPDGVRIGDRVDIVDDAGELYLSTRILRLECSEVDREHKAMLGEHIIKDSGISQKVEELASQFAEIAKSRVFYTWVAYADDENGNGISLSPANKDYLGIAANKLTKTVDISDPSVFEWTKIKGDKGEPGDGVTSVVAILDQYYLSTSSVIPEGGNWSATMPEWSSGHYIWERKAVTWSDGSTTYTDPILNSALNHANEAAEFAKQQANTAAQSATAAERAANNADTAAQEAANKATQAENAANSASGIAAQAKSEAEAAQEAADKANQDIVTINNDIASVREEVSEGLETVINEMSVDYAKKTDLVEIEGSLQAQIASNAAELSITHSAIEDIKIDASEAVKNANAANTMALAAQSTADNAKTAADKAQDFADAASAAAQTAQTEATTAQTAANTAKTAADNAQAVADAAGKDLQDAKADLEAVKNSAEATAEDIAAAQEAVNTALAAAIKAKSDAITAQSEARIAQIKADAAARNAETAQQAAAQAQNDADNAKAAAVKAQADAQDILDTLETMGNKVTQAETNIKKNADAIALTATKSEVTETLKGYYTKTETDAAITVESESIRQTVSQVETTAENAKATAESAILQLAETLNFLVANDENGSFFQQDANGRWYFTSAETKAELESIRTLLANLSSENSTSLEEVKKQLDALNNLSSYVQINTSGESPFIELGEKNSPYKTVITNEYIKYYNGSIELACFDKDGLTADKVTVRKELNAVGLRVRKKSNGYVGIGLF